MIAILLCTYNGGRYLDEQLKSLMVQTYKNFVVYIHDDGSTDESLQIIGYYMIQYPQRFIMMADSMKHRGAGPSFMWLLQNVKADYYMFCDQDDYWLSNKVEHTLNRMEEVENLNQGKPVLIHTDLKLTDEVLKVTHDSFWKYQNFKVDVSKRREFIGFGNIVTGCTMIINEAAKQVAFPYDGRMLHDYWLALKVAKYGVVDNLKEQTILYRQHGDNEAGAGNVYKRGRIGYKNFLRNLDEERKRVNEVSGAGIIRWFIYRVIYFYHRHFR